MEAVAAERSQDIPEAVKLDEKQSHSLELAEVEEVLSYEDFLQDMGIQTAQKSKT